MSPALPSRTSPSRAARATGVALALALGLSGCGAGLQAQTYQDRAAADATNDVIGTLAVRNLKVLPPTSNEGYAVGNDARVGLVVVNEGTDVDRLTTVTSDAASRVEVLAPDGQPGTLSVEPNAVASGYVLVLRGLTRELRSGQYVQMELTFAENGSGTMLVPVEVTGRPGPQREGYEVGETDSNGDVLEHEEEGAEGEGAAGEGAEGAEAEEGSVLEG